VPRQQQLHAKVAAAIEGLYDDTPSERVGEITDHLLKAASFADVRKVVRYLTLSGKNALEAAAFKEALRTFRSALTHEDALEVRERAELLTSAAIADRGLDR
jgi:hypothetical protein